MQVCCCSPLRGVPGWHVPSCSRGKAGALCWVMPNLSFLRATEGGPREFSSKGSLSSKDHRHYLQPLLKQLLGNSWWCCCWYLSTSCGCNGRSVFLLHVGTGLGFPLRDAVQLHLQLFLPVSRSSTIALVHPLPPAVATYPFGEEAFPWSEAVPSWCSVSVQQWVSQEHHTGEHSIHVAPVSAYSSSPGTVTQGHMAELQPTWNADAAAHHCQNGKRTHWNMEICWLLLCAHLLTRTGDCHSVNRWCCTLKPQNTDIITRTLLKLTLFFQWAVDFDRIVYWRDARLGVWR